MNTIQCANGQIDKWKNYLRSALCSIKHNKVYALFCVVGMFGLFMQNSERRAREYALRLAVGATPRRLLEFVMLESVVVTLLACLPGGLLSVFIYEYTLPEWIGVCVTILIMVVFSMLSTWYPAYRVTKVNPAETLK